MKESHEAIIDEQIHVLPFLEMFVPEHDLNFGCHRFEAGELRLRWQ